MDTTEVVRKYEMVMILDAMFTGEERDAKVKDVVDSINKEGGKVVNSQVWIEKQKFTFKIKKKKEGAYYLINFEGPGSKLAKIQRNLRLKEYILRFSIGLVGVHANVETVKS